MKNFLLTVIVILGCVITVQAESMDAEYRISFGFLGELGRAKAHLERNGENYRIEIEGRATGIAKSLSKNRREKQVSEGHIVNGLLIPDRYTIVRSYGNKVIEKCYTIDHIDKTVMRSDVRKTDGKIVWQEQKRTDFYAENDLLTLYFNMAQLIPDKEKSASYKFKALGAEKQKGDVEVIVMDKTTGKLYENELGSRGYWYLTAIIHQKIFSSSRGELLLSVDEEGITDKAVLKDVMLFGDIRAERIK